MKTDVIKEIKDKKPFKDFHYYNLVMSNGDKINIGKKKDLKEGDTLMYEITGDNQQEFRKAETPKNTFKPQTQFKADPAKQNSIEVQVCLKESREWLEHRGYASEDKKEQLDELISVTKYLHKKIFND